MSDAHWFSLVLGAAASLEDAANCLQDPDAKRAASHAAEHYRKRANEAWERRTGLTDRECRALQEHASDMEVTGYATDAVALRKLLAARGHIQPEPVGKFDPATHFLIDEDDQAQQRAAEAVDAALKRSGEQKA